MEKINYWELSITLIFSMTCSILFADYLKMSYLTYKAKEALSEISESWTPPEIQSKNDRQVINEYSKKITNKIYNSHKQLEIVKSIPSIDVVRLGKPKTGYATAAQTCQFWRDQLLQEPNNSKYKQYKIAACARARTLMY